MPLRIRRGTNAERQTITPLDGELLYTTDTKNLFVGDGTTVGGNRLNVRVLNNGVPVLPSFTTAEEATLTPPNGALILNTTTNKIRARVNGAWVDLN